MKETDQIVTDSQIGHVKRKGAVTSHYHISLLLWRKQDKAFLTWLGWCWGWSLQQLQRYRQCRMNPWGCKMPWHGGSAVPLVSYWTWGDHSHLWYVLEKEDLSICLGNNSHLRTEPLPTGEGQETQVAETQLGRPNAHCLYQKNVGWAVWRTIWKHNPPNPEIGIIETEL